MRENNLKAMQENHVDRGRLRIQVQSQARPIENAQIAVSYTGDPESTVEQVVTDGNGQTEELTLPAPPLEYSMEPSASQPYAEYTLRITAPGYEPVTISGTEILPDATALQEVRLTPLVQPEDFQDIVIPAHTLYGDYPPKIAEAEIKPVSQTGEIVLSRVVIPEFIVVHDGSPRDLSLIHI